MAIWKTKWGWRADFLLNGERIMAAGFFKYKDEARQWIREEKERRRNLEKSFSQDKGKDLSLWTLAKNT